VIADFTSSGRSFTGTVSATQEGETIQCTANGKQKGRSNVKIRPGPCDIGVIVLHGKFDPSNDTIMGHFVLTRRGRKVRTGTFTLIRVASASRTP